MAHRGKNEEHTADEAIPLSQDDDEAIVWMPEVFPSDSALVNVGNGDREDENEAEQSVPDPQMSFIREMDRGACVSHLSFLHDEVEKMFEMPKKFDIDELSSSTVVPDRNRRPSEVTVTDRHFDEHDYAVHRRVSFPHTHQPLRSLSNKSLKTLKPAKVKKKKKKKKKKMRSFPSKGALKSPPIPEEVEDKDDDDDDEEETDESDDMDIEEEREEEGEFVGGGSVYTDQPRKASAPGITVGFFIGEEDGETSPTEETKGFPGDSKTSSSSRFKRAGSEEPVTSAMLGSVSDEPQVSQHAASLHIPHGGGGSRLRKDSAPQVKFLLGDDGSEASLVDRDDPVWVPQHPNGDVPDGGAPHASQSDSKLGKQKHRKHHHEHFRKEHLIMRRQRGSEVHLDNMEQLKRSPTETEEAMLLQKADLDNLASHRFEDVRGIRRHKINRHRSAMHSIVHISKLAKEKKPHKPKKIDHSPHEVFVELDKLHVGPDPDAEWEWREKARWIKFEEDVEEGAERWGKPHVASLSFHSLLELRRGLEHGTLLLDLDASDLQTIIHRVVDNMTITDQIRDQDKGRLIRTLLLKHKHVSERSTFLPRNVSYSNLVGLDTSRHYHQRRKSMIPNLSQASFGNIGSSADLKKLNEEYLGSSTPHHEAAKLEMVKVDVDNNMTDSVHIGISAAEPKRNVQDIMRRIPADAEASIVLVGNVDFLEKPAVAFVRLEEGQILDNLTEVPLPTRFVIILLGPESAMDYHEVGRSISTLMANQSFHEVAYKADSREQLLHAINSFLDDSIVLPPGDWDQKTLLPIMDMARKRANLRHRKKKKQEEQTGLLDKEHKKIPTDPLLRTGCLFGGLINDIKRRYPHYVSDLRDSLNLQCLMALVFIFFACFSPCIAFGGILSEKTKGMMGVSETVVSTSLCGVVFGLFCGQPLLIVGATGPVLVFEQSLYKFCDANEIEFLSFRCWIGMWVCFITTVTVALEGSFLIRYVTRFTEEIFAILISLIFIYEAIKKVDKTFTYHPLNAVFCPNDSSSYPNLYHNGSNITNITTATDNITTTTPVYESDDHPERRNEPNTALLTTILVLGTFLIAYFLRIFRNSKFLGRSARRALGDFGILIALFAMVLTDYCVKDTYTQKLDIQDSLSPTSKKRYGWFVNPMGSKKSIEVWMVFAAIIPAFLIFILLFMEIQLTEVILNKKDRRLRKGSGFHLDQFIMGVLTFVCGLLGLPWMCAATVRTVAHTSALSVFSRTHAPGEKPKLLYVIEQRLTNVMVSLLIGVTLFMGPLLRAIPVAVLFGVFLYLGVSSLNGVQFFQRIKLLLMPVKHHPEFGFVRRVRTLKMHIFTVIQLVCLVILWVIKSTQGALAFPFVLLLLIPLRLQIMSRFFTKQELHELDKEEDESDDDEDEPDFYHQVHMPI
ncbi:anion exchange protein 2-like isoform X2 [Haliotis rufescens]|uniref:anion exchange protein 2-like isoform X2 n=1 Tax=Haliotis rufescens TaxID=6454 RepID=UPI00201EDB53|nr:anion exchange protein 2-like isoform X2 [Haliotis rufescens]